MDRVLHVSIVTPASTAFTGEALAITVPGAQSPFQVLYNHAPIISSLEPGVLKIEDPANHIHIFASREGFVEVLKNNVNVVVSELIPAESIDASKAEADLAQARSIADTHPDRQVRKAAQADIAWAETRIRAARMLNS